MYGHYLSPPLLLLSSSWLDPSSLFTQGESTGTACASSSKTTQSDVRPKQPVPRPSIQAPKKAEGKDPSGADRSQRKKKQQSDALTQEIFYVHMAKVRWMVVDHIWSKSSCMGSVDVS